jgi:hypothetical protein
MKRYGTGAFGALQRSNFLRHKRAAAGRSLFRGALVGGALVGGALIDGALMGDAVADKA